MVRPPHQTTLDISESLLLVSEPLFIAPGWQWLHLLLRAIISGL